MFAGFSTRSWTFCPRLPEVASQSGLSSARVRVADGPPQRIGDKGMQHKRAKKSGVGERRASGEQEYYLANLPTDANFPTLATTSRRAGAASRLSNSSRRNSTSTTSRAAHGTVCIAMR